MYSCRIRVRLEIFSGAKADGNKLSNEGDGLIPCSLHITNIAVDNFIEWIVPSSLCTCTLDSDRDIHVVGLCSSERGIGEKKQYTTCISTWKWSNESLMFLTWNGCQDTKPCEKYVNLYF